MPRERLPGRRAQVTDCTRWPLTDGRRVHVSAGFAKDGRILETFIRGGGRVGSEIDALLDDLAVLISHALQHGDSIGAMVRGIGRTPDGKPASVAGAVLDRLFDIERETGGCGS